MRVAIKNFIFKNSRYIDFILFPFIFPAALVLKMVRKIGVQRMPLCKTALNKVGVMPVINHYTEPYLDKTMLRYDLKEVRPLTAIDWNDKEQISLLQQFHFADELKDIDVAQTNKLSFYLRNGTFESGDAEYWYSIIRLKKPKKIYEIGSGNSTLMTIKAIKMNQVEDPRYRCEHICIEPYKAKWLERAGVITIRKRVEELDKCLFQKLDNDDMFFIDSSHVIRPQGDVLFECLEILPILRSGVIVHIHDIFSPRDYPADFIVDKSLFMNEQYLYESFLSYNKEWKIIGALNYLHHKYYDQLREKCPFLTKEREPGSFYIQKN